MPYDQSPYGYDPYGQAQGWGQQQAGWPPGNAGYQQYPQQQPVQPTQQQAQWYQDPYTGQWVQHQTQQPQWQWDPLTGQWVQQAAQAQPEPAPEPAEPEAPALDKHGKPVKEKKAREKLDPKIAKPLGFALNGLYWVILVVLVGGAVLFAASKDPDKALPGGFRSYNVLTASMTPTIDPETGRSSPKGLGANGGFKAGDTIIVRMIPASQVKVGDIITYNPNVNDAEGKAYLTHRCIEVLDNLNGKPGLYFVTKGDHNPSEDPPITENMFIGVKMFHVPGVGKFLMLLQGHPIISLVMFACFFGCIFMIRWYFSKPQAAPEPKKKQKKAQPEDEDA